MVNPFDCIKYDRTQAELEEFLLFTVVAAGKTATTQAKKLDGFLNFIPEDLSFLTPFQRIMFMDKKDTFNFSLTHFKLGQYARIGKAFKQLVRSDINLKTVSVTDLEKIDGIGPKTARFFIAFSRPNQKFAILDTHVLKYLKEQGLTTISSTPSGKKYLELEAKYFEHLDSLGVKDYAAFDLELWKKYTKTKENSLTATS